MTSDVAAPLWDYEFSVWPHENSDPALFELFRNMGTRQVMTFTGDQFGLFRAALERNGLTLREITRVPHHEPETVL